MSKRFTETDKWKSPSFRKMPATQKLLLFYLYENCDNAGFIEWDAEACAFSTGMKIEHVEGAYKGLKSTFKGAKDSEWIYLPEFLKTQKNLPLNPSNNAHRQIISLIEDKRDLFASIAKELIGAKKGLKSPTGKGKGNSQVKDYTPEFEAWWELFGRRGSKLKAFGRWEEHRESMPPDLDRITKQYTDYCRNNDRSQKDAEGWINGRMWESDWSSGGPPAKAEPQPGTPEYRRMYNL